MSHSDRWELPLATQAGAFVAIYSGAGLRELHFPTAGQPSRRAVSARVPREILSWHRLTTRAVAARLRGRAEAVLPPLDWTGRTEFQQKVWRALLAIPASETRSYGAVAAQISHPQAQRAVGAACGANPIPLLVPCHRVLAANRKLGGFSGGLAWKRQLLEVEGGSWQH